MKSQLEVVAAPAVVSPTEHLPAEGEVTSAVRTNVVKGQPVGESENPAGTSSQEHRDPESDHSDPIKVFKLWLEQATPEELEEAEPKFEEQVLSCHRNGREWRLAMGEHLYKHREVVKKRGSRDWTKWVTSTLDMARQSAYDLMRRWTEEYGYGLDEHNEPDQPNPKADAIKEAIAKAREKRKGRKRAPSAPELSDHVRVSWPEVYVTRQDHDRFKEARERDEEGVNRICRAAFFAVIGKADPEAEPGPADVLMSVPAQLEDAAGEEKTNVGVTN